MAINHYTVNFLLLFALLFLLSFIVRQSGLSEKFTSASEQTGRETLAFIRRSWASVDGYLDWIGFNQVWRNRLRQKFLTDKTSTIDA